MRELSILTLLVCIGIVGLSPARAADRPITVLAAENFYGDVATQVGGDQVEVTSIIGNPNQDPHLFEASPGVVRQIADSQIVIYNGADYDAWIEKLLTSSPRPGRKVIVVATLAGTKAGQNPHLWYDPGTMPKVAKALADAFTKADPSHAAEFATRLATFEASLKPITDKINSITKQYAGVPVTASEPVFGYMATALKLKMRNERFQMAVMNDTEPSARDVAAFEKDLRSRSVRVLFYNKQASNPTVQRLVGIAEASRVPVVGVTETEPSGTKFQDWIIGELSETEAALGQSK